MGFFTHHLCVFYSLGSFANSVCKICYGLPKSVPLRLPLLHLTINPFNDLSQVERVIRCSGSTVLT